ncbi:MAG: hypothetical protein HW394_137 [Acidobacteria bacterium]|nr:hypothetical protein [Acidobacteriota bacterium]
MRCNRMTGFVALCLLALIAGCATRTTAPPLPAALAYPEFMYPTVPPPLATADAAGGVDRGWRFLQNNDLVSADLEFAAALQRTPALYPAQAGAAYVALARREYDLALGGFDAGLRTAPMYVPALVGRGQTLLALKRDASAVEAFEAALTVDPSLADVRSRVDVLRFRSLQDVIDAARAAAAAGRMAEARSAYERALHASPESAFLYRELGLVERKQDSVEAALGRFRRAAELDPGDAASLIQMGELLEDRRDFAGAEAAYRRAADIEPSGELSARMAVVLEKARDARLPAEFRAIAGSSQIARGELAALLGVRLEDILRGAPAKDVVITDAQGHWAAAWVVQVARTGVMEPFANHTFQPGARITRADLAGAVSRVVAVIAASRPDVRPRLAQRPQIADVAAGHLSYPAVSVAVASGVMPLLDGGRFQVARPVSGAEAIDVVARVRALAGASR